MGQKIILLLGGIFLLTACQFTKTPEVSSVRQAVVVMQPTEGNSAIGVVSFESVPDGVRIKARFENLTVGSSHGFHIHEFGDCTGSDGKTAGGHYNPHGMSHAGPESHERHVGDLGNVVADQDGVGVYEFVDDHIKLNGPNSIVGRGVILHEKIDDLTTQPTGAAGARIACGVVGIKGDS